MRRYLLRQGRSNIFDKTLFGSAQALALRWCDRESTAFGPNTSVSRLSTESSCQWSACHRNSTFNATPGDVTTLHIRNNNIEGDVRIRELLTLVICPGGEVRVKQTVFEVVGR